MGISIFLTSGFMPKWYYFFSALVDGFLLDGRTSTSPLASSPRPLLLLALAQALFADLPDVNFAHARRPSAHRPIFRAWLLLARAPAFRMMMRVSCGEGQHFADRKMLAKALMLL